MLSRSPAASGQCAGAVPTGAEPRASGRAGDWIRAGNIGGSRLEAGDSFRFVDVRLKDRVQLGDLQ